MDLPVEHVLNSGTQITEEWILNTKQYKLTNLKNSIRKKNRNEQILRNLLKRIKMSDMHVTETTKWEGRENCPQKTYL